MPPLLAEIDWNALLREPDALPLLVLVPIMGIVGLAAIIAPQWRKVQQTNAEARLKERMIERGFTADEIIRVINTGVGHARKGKVADRLDSTKPFTS
jgi:hypothetical protein